MKLIKLAVTLSIAVLAASASAASNAPTESGGAAAFIKKQFESRLASEGQKIDSVVKTPYGGLYEIRVGPDIFYTDEKAKYVFVGRVLNAETQEDYTKARIEDISKIK